MRLPMWLVHAWMNVLFWQQRRQAGGQRAKSPGRNTPVELGILFDIDGLGGGRYGAAAYGILFRRADIRAMRNVALHDGDTQATLDGHTRVYCIAVESFDRALIDDIEQRLRAAVDPGLLPVGRRFLRDAVKREPVVFAGLIDPTGMLIDCDMPWIRDAWREAGGMIGIGSVRRPPAR